MSLTPYALCIGAMKKERKQTNRGKQKYGNADDHRVKAHSIIIGKFMQGYANTICIYPDIDPSREIRSNQSEDNGYDKLEYQSDHCFSFH